MNDAIIEPVQPGFAFECQRCGRCCYKNVVLDQDEATYLAEHGFELRYTVSINVKTDEVLAIQPCIPPGPCRAYCQSPPGSDQPKCLIYKDRPASCRLYPLIMRIYHKNPPTWSEIRASMNMPVDYRGPMKKYYRPLDDHRWAVLGCQREPNCPGIGKGKPWTENDIKRFIVENIYTYEHGTQASQETSRNLLENFQITDKESLKRILIEEYEIYHDDKLRLLIYKSRDLPPDFSKTTSVDFNLNKVSVLKRPLK
jgi:Fe-S-cluster containining protein